MGNKDLGSMTFAEFCERNTPMAAIAKAESARLEKNRQKDVLELIARSSLSDSQKWAFARLSGEMTGAEVEAAIGGATAFNTPAVAVSSELERAVSLARAEFMSIKNDQPCLTEDVFIRSELARQKIPASADELKAVVAKLSHVVIPHSAAGISAPNSLEAAVKLARSEFATIKNDLPYLKEKDFVTSELARQKIVFKDDDLKAIASDLFK